MTKKNPPMLWHLPDVVNPPDHIDFCIPVPNDIYHIAAFKGALLELGTSANWQRDELHKASPTAQVWREIFYNLSRCEICIPPSGGIGEGIELMIRQNPTNPCKLESSIDGINWCEWADLSLCLPANNQPAGDQPQPAAGGCQSYHGVISNGSRWLIPTPVSSGDTIEVTNRTGATNILGSGNWYCVDGQIFFGACLGSVNYDGSDPVPSAPHLGLVLYVNGIYYDMPGVFTVPGGVANQNAEIVMNAPSASTISGDISFDVKVCNHGASTFTHTFDLKLSPGGWLPDTQVSGVSGVWTPGTGYVGSDFQHPNHYRGVNVRNTFPARDLTQIELIYDLTLGTVDVPSALAAYIQTASVLQSVDYATSVNGSNLVLSWTGTDLGRTTIDVWVTCSLHNPQDGACTLTKIIVSGVGTDPF